jgi:parvulin-like peptidyl-prolyl isomerase
MTMAQARFQVLFNLTAQKLKTKITSSAKVSTADEQKYYDQNKQAYHQNESRQVEHILVGSKKQAEMIEKKLQAGASFASLAKKYSKDTGTAAQGGKYLAVEGQDVPQFDKAAFGLKTGATSPPVHSQFGWHVIRALGPIKPAHTQSFKQVQASIQQNLIAQKQQAAWSTWLNDLPKKYQGKIAYQTGYAPATTATSTVPTTT